MFGRLKGENKGKVCGKKGFFVDKLGIMLISEGGYVLRRGDFMGIIKRYFVLCGLFVDAALSFQGIVWIFYRGREL